MFGGSSVDPAPWRFNPCINEEPDDHRIGIDMTILDVIRYHYHC